MCRGPAGAMRTMLGVAAETSSHSSMVTGQPAAWAMAVRCSMVLVEPPKAMSRAMPLRMARESTMSRAVTPCSRSSMTFMPARLARRMRSEKTAGTVPLPGRAMPRASARQQMELAVNMPEQLPQVGQAVSSRREHSSTVMVPAVTWPTASKRLLRSVWQPSAPRPASMGPPETSTVGMFRRQAAMSIPGTILSQLGISTMASNRCPCTAHSTESAMTSRLVSE